MILIGENLLINEELITRATMCAPEGKDTHTRLIINLAGQDTQVLLDAEAQQVWRLLTNTQRLIRIYQAQPELFTYSKEVLK